MSGVGFVLVSLSCVNCSGGQVPSRHLFVKVVRGALKMDVADWQLRRTYAVFENGVCGLIKAARVLEFPAVMTFHPLSLSPLRCEADQRRPVIGSRTTLYLE